MNRCNLRLNGVYVKICENSTYEIKRAKKQWEITNFAEEVVFIYFYFICFANVAQNIRIHTNQKFHILTLFFATNNLNYLKAKKIVSKSIENKKVQNEISIKL